jgi:hypothetical protein
MAMLKPRLFRAGRHRLEGENGLDSDLADGPDELDQALAKVGLELWQSPDGFWAVRVRSKTESGLGEPSSRSGR